MMSSSKTSSNSSSSTSSSSTTTVSSTTSNNNNNNNNIKNKCCCDNNNNMEDDDRNDANNEASDDEKKMKITKHSSSSHHDDNDRTGRKMATDVDNNEETLITKTTTSRNRVGANGGGAIHLLNARELFGRSSYPIRNKSKSMVELASKIAWSRRRLTNTILTVGPGTPVSVCTNSSGSNNNNNNNNNSSSATPPQSEDDDNHDDDVSMEDVNSEEEEEEDEDALHPLLRDSRNRREETMDDDKEDAEEDDDDDNEEGVEGGDEEEEVVVEDNESENAFDREFDSITRNRLSDAFQREALRLLRRRLRQPSTATGNSDNNNDNNNNDNDNNNNDDESNNGGNEDDDNENEGEDELQAEVFLQIIQGSLRRRRLLRRRRMLLRGEDSDDDEDDMDEDEDDDDENEDMRMSLSRGRHSVRGGGGGRRRNSNNRSLRPSIRHGGCINTACWLDRNWRVSDVSASTTSPSYGSSTSSSIMAYCTEECPTQIVTSGDDRLLKIWSVSGAMGTDNPLPGGWNTFCPFADAAADGGDETPDMSKVVEEWNSSNINKGKQQQELQGSVVNIATLSTGHRGNVFHVTPCYEAGKVLTCGADGYLRLVDIVAESSSVVIHPYVMESSDDDDDDEMMDLPFVFHSGMAYSHHLLTRDTGLLCSERGLHFFDLRLPPRQQQRSSLLQGSNRNNLRKMSCKACAIWSPHYSSSITSVQSELLGSSYVFAGGASADVHLYDLRMDGSRNKKVVERYRPRGLIAPPGAGPAGSSGSGSNVSVSGLDVSKDGKELLVSYESDQIYSFPICHQSKHYPSVDEIDMSCETFDNDPDAALPELASYGGHLNRFTFLKNARYAGPNDKYICTGSDSGNAWIYERETGSVVSLLGADSSTCNGVIPHPILPFFITYGIDSTAKLWRATIPVDPYTDDSSAGRAKCSLRRPYEMSPVARTWEGVQTLLKHIDDEPAAMPDYIASSEEVSASGRFSSPCRRGIFGTNENNTDNSGNSSSPRIGNALLVLPSILRQNRYECYRAYHEELDVPVAHPLIDFTVRLSQARLSYQADRLGLIWDPWKPWAFLQPPQPDSSDGGNIHPADLVPDFPSDWINFDPEMKSANVLLPREQFCFRDDSPYGEDLIESYFPGFMSSPRGSCCSRCPPWLDKNKIPRPTDNLQVGVGDDELASQSSSEHAWQETSSKTILYETALLLKEGGNQAMKENLLNTAARRYDKAVQYCAVAFMRYFDGDQSLKLLTEGHHEIVVSSDNKSKPNTTRKTTNIIVTWSPLLRILITSRLNMALLFLKSSYLQPDRAAGQARAALKLLAPFSEQEGKVISIRDKKQRILKNHEPVETYKDAQALKAKAYFRLGSAELQTGDYGAAVRNFEASLKCSPTNSTAKPDALTVKRLQEAKRKQKSKKKRDRAKFQRMHFDNEPDGGNRGEDEGTKPN